MQDLPFGERTLTLLSRETITVLNVIRTIVPKRIVKQYTLLIEVTHDSHLSHAVPHFVF